MISNFKESQVNDLKNLSTRLLQTLDEGVFFTELGKFIKTIVGKYDVLVYQSFDDHSSQLKSFNGETIEGGSSLTKGEGLSGYVARTKRSYYSNSIDRDPLFANFKYNRKVVAELCVPIAVQGTVLGTVNIQSLSSDAEFDQNTINSILSILKYIERPILNMKMYLNAKNLNEILIKKVEAQEIELKSRSEGIKETNFNKVSEVEIIGKSEALKDVLSFVDKVAPTSSTVLIYGESGVGKELVAKRIHTKSQRHEAPYVIVNCGAIQETLLESELFGHVKGSFTGAINDKVGLVEKANGGTLFLDEVGELSLGMQTKILRFLQEGEFYPVGATLPRKVDVRILSATNRDLKQEVSAGKFREDLFYRLNTISLRVPSLRERKEDIIILTSYFLNKNKGQGEEKSLTPGAMKILETYSWPGNIRELRNIIERASILCDGRFIDESQLSDCEIENDQDQVTEEEYKEMTLADLERKHIVRTLDHLSGNKTKTAKTLGITVKTLYNKLHNYGMIQSRESLQ